MAPLSVAILKHGLCKKLSMSDLQEIRTENNPKVTIVVPIYNVEQYIYIILECIY